MRVIVSYALGPAEELNMSSDNNNTSSVYYTIHKKVCEMSAKLILPLPSLKVHYVLPRGHSLSYSDVLWEFWQLFRYHQLINLQMNTQNVCHAAYNYNIFIIIIIPERGKMGVH